MDSDVHLPERLGIYQSVGDTAGPGGMIRALRTIPMFVTIAEALRNTLLMLGLLTIPILCLCV